MYCGGMYVPICVDLSFSQHLIPQKALSLV